MSFARGVDIYFSEKKRLISDAILVSHYLGVNKIPVCINSPLREDNKPSLGLFSFDNERIRYIDFATGEKGTIIDLLQKKWELDYKSTWEKIINELYCGTAGIITFRGTNGVKIKKNAHNSNLQVKIREYKDYDILYWKSYGVPKELLIYANVYPISYIIFGDSYIKADKYAYVFVEFKDNMPTYKIYQPKNKGKLKWLSSHNKSVISLWTTLPQIGETLVICSSLKDALCLRSVTGIPTIALQGEGYGMSQKAVKELKERYNSVYILFDSDEAGETNAEKLQKQTGFTKISLPKTEKGKDISDIYFYYGKNYLLNILNKMLPAIMNSLF